MLLKPTTRRLQYNKEQHYTRPPKCVECPVCKKLFISWMINGHVEECLTVSTDKGQKVKVSVPKPNDGAPLNKFKMNTYSTPSTKSTEQPATSFVNPSGPPPKKAKLENTISFQQSSQTKGNSTKNNSFVPLAEKLRPKTLAEYVGQTQVVGDKCILRNLLEADEIPSLIFWGPPGCGKTTLANIIANNTRKANAMRFVKLSATMTGVAEVKDVIKVAKNEQIMFRRKTILFVDEIHRFNKLQQDTFLPHVENGTITLIGATTENPSFHVNSALLSRCRVIVLQKLATEEIVIILQAGIHVLQSSMVDNKETLSDHSLVDKEESDKIISVDKNSLSMLASLSDGDARSALNGLEMAFQSKVNTLKQKTLDQMDSKHHVITVDDIKESFQRSHILYDKNGEEHYNVISALHKSVRGGDENAALYWLGRMLVGGEEPLYIARRLVRMASEDIGLADPLALNQAVSAFQACHLIGKPECDVILAQATVYLARAPKSVEVYKAYGRVVEHIKSHEGSLPGVPLHLRNASTKLLQDLGYAKGYKYNPDYDMPVDQTYLPKELQGIDFLKKS